MQAAGEFSFNRPWFFLLQSWCYFAYTFMNSNLSSTYLTYLWKFWLRSKGCVIEYQKNAEMFAVWGRP